MKIPKKITPDKISDSIVEVRYTTAVPFEALVGIFYQSAKGAFQYTNRPLGNQLPIALPSLPKELKLSFGGVNLFHNDNIKIQIQPNSIIFNCLNTYVGWDIYKSEIEKALVVFSDSVKIENYSRIGVRYVTEYPNSDLSDCVKFKFTFGLPEIKSNTYSFRSEFKWEEYKVILNLNNKLLVIREHGKQPTPTSTIDIDVIEEKLNEKDLRVLLTKLDKVHSVEKEVFFNILKENFLVSLHPEY